MISVVFKKELLSHLFSRQFAICTTLAVLLMSTNGLVSSQNWSLKKASYQAKKAIEVQKPRDITYYGALAADTDRSAWLSSDKYQVAPRALRAPRPLELFARGDEARLGQAVPVLLFEVPYIAEQVDPLSADNHFLALFNTYDMVYVFQLVLGLLAILMASETISSEKEDGTLRLTLTTNISRAQLLAGKLLGGMTTLAIPTALGFIILMIILLGTDGAGVSLAEWWGMGVLFLLSLLYLTVLYLIGLVVSCATGRSATSLVYALFLWALLVVVLPNTIAALLNERANMNEKNDQADARAAQVWDALEQDLQDLVRTHGQRRYPPIELVEQKIGGMFIDFGSKPELYMDNIADTPGLATFQDIFRSGELLRLQYAQRAWNAQVPLVETFLRRLARQNAQFQRLFPAGAYAQTASAIAGTSQEEFYGFIEQVRDYRRQLLGYLKDRDAFGSRTYFNDDSGWEADLGDMPRFQEQQATSYQRLRQSLPALATLLLYAAGLFVLANRLFARYDAA